MTTTIDRKQHLETTIRDAEQELARLRSQAAAEQRKQAQRNEVDRFRSGVESARSQLTNYGATIEANLKAMEQFADENAATIATTGIHVHDPAKVNRVKFLAAEIANLFLSRAQHKRQLAGLEEKLVGMERSLVSPAA